MVFKAIQNALNDKMEERGWAKTAKHFGETIKSLCELLDVLECDINVEDYPRVMYEAGRHREVELEQPEEEVHQGKAGQQQDMGCEGAS